MNLQANLELLKDYFPEAWQKISAIEKTLNKSLVRMAAGREEGPTLRVGERYIHHKQRPLQEARELIERFDSIRTHTDIIFYGVGLGYHISAFIGMHPGRSFSIYEPVPEVFYQFLSHSDLGQFPLKLIKNIFLETRPEEVDGLCSRIVGGIRKTVLVIEIPAYQDIFPEKRRTFFTRFEEHLENRRFSLATTAAFQKRWTINSLNNLHQVLDSPNLLLEARGRFNNRPAVMVASGPSLEEELGNLKKIRDRGLAYIFSVGSAINTLVQNGIHPHAACTYDPTEENQIVCQEVLEKDIRTIPLIFGSTVGYETLEQYPGPKTHFLISQDPLAAFYLKPLAGQHQPPVNDAATISVITLQLLYQLGFDPIILVGQNLAYRENRLYAAGSTYHQWEVNQEELDSTITVKDVCGGEVRSTRGFIRMRRQLESYLLRYRDRDIINTTMHGAHIEGARFKTLERVIEERLPEKAADDYLLESTQSSYDAEHLVKQSRTMKNAFTSVAAMLEKCKDHLDSIGELAGSGDINKIQHSYDRFNRSVESLRNNQFFATCISPMNRVELELLILAVPDISLENDPLAKARLMEQEFRPFLLGCEQDIKTVTPGLRQLDQAVQSFYKQHIIREKAARIKVLVVEADGVLTDGTLYCSPSGDALKRLDLRDRDGVVHLRERGVITLLVDSEDDPIVKAVASKWGMELLPERTANSKVIDRVLERYEVKRDEIAFLSNRPERFDALKPVGLCILVGDHRPDLRRKADHVLKAGGGQGAIMEIAELMTKNKTKI